MPPLVSVIIPTHNRASQLCDCIRSVLRQDYPEIEIVVVDDGSSDDTPAVVEGFSDERIRFIRQAHQGSSVARNTGIENARGDLIAFLDSDDEWMPTKLSLQVPLFDDPEVGWVYCDLQFLGEEGKSARLFEQREPVRGNVLIHLLVRRCNMILSTVVVRRKLLEKIGLFDPSLFRFQDHDLYYRLAAVSRVDYVDEVLVRYRTRGRDRTFEAVKWKHEQQLEIRRRVLGRVPGLKHAMSRRQYRHAFLYEECKLGLMELSAGNFEEARTRLRRCTREATITPRFWLYYLVIRFAPGLARKTVRWRFEPLFASADKPDDPSIDPWGAAARPRKDRTDAVNREQVRFDRA